MCRSKPFLLLCFLIPVSFILLVVFFAFIESRELLTAVIYRENPSYGNAAAAQLELAAGAKDVSEILFPFERERGMFFYLCTEDGKILYSTGRQSGGGREAETGFASSAPDPVSAPATIGSVLGAEYLEEVRRNRNDADGILLDVQGRTAVWAKYLPELNSYFFAGSSAGHLDSLRSRRFWRVFWITLFPASVLMLLLLYGFYLLDLQRRRADIEHEKDVSLRSVLLDTFGRKIGPEAAQVFQLSNQLLEEDSSEVLTYELNRSAAELVNFYRNIEGLLNIDAGAIPEGGQLLYLDEILNSILVNKASHARRKGIHIQLAVEDRPLVTRGQDYYVRVALENVIDNAIIYTRQGGQILVLARRGLRSIVVEVSDEGPGFLPEDREKLFKRFTTLSAKSSNAENQTGLGLYIAKELLSAMNGEIYLTLTGPEGSVFRLEFPFAGDPD